MQSFPNPVGILPRRQIHLFSRVWFDEIQFAFRSSMLRLPTEDISCFASSYRGPQNREKTHCIMVWKLIEGSSNIFPLNSSALFFYLISVYYYISIFFSRTNASLDFEQSLLFVSPLSETSETRKWPDSWLKTRDGPFFSSRGFAARRSRMRALLSLNLGRETARSRMPTDVQLATTLNIFVTWRQVPLSKKPSEFILGQKWSFLYGTQST